MSTPSQTTTILEGINIALAIALLVRWFLIPNPSLHTLFTDEDTIEHLHAPGAVSLRIEQLAPSITVEDIVRELHEHPERLSSPEAQQLFKEMQETQSALLANEERLQAIELELNRLALQVFNDLSPEEQARIRSRRNTDSVEGIEAQYWREVLQQDEQGEREP